VFYLTRGEHGHTRNIYVPNELRDEVAAGVAAYRRYRELGQEIAEGNARRLGLANKKKRRR
jgi:chromatin segregation and condensation protein Rec8/ScpA/Scc1 (kleisin family)